MIQHPYSSDRRQLLKSAACGFAGLAFAGLATKASQAESGTSLGKPLFTPKAKRVIFIFMQGGPSQVDTFDYKPILKEKNGEKLHFRNSRKLANTGMSGEETIMTSPWAFQQYGETGHYVSDLFPHIAQHVDDLCFLHGMHTEGVAHGPSTLFLHTGSINLVRPSVGAWISYGLGSENDNLPAFMTICPSSANGGPRNFSNAFLPTRFQGTAVGRASMPSADAKISHISNADMTLEERRRQFDLLQSLNREQAGAAGDHEFQAVLSSYELAWRMQMTAPDVLDLSKESASTLNLYGIDGSETDDFGRQCLMARRLAESGVRYIQVNYADNGSNPRWDQHSKIQLHATHAKATDKPVAGLLADLKARGLLDDTLVWWGGEFGRNPFTQGNDGRDHNPRGFTHFLAGGGVKSGFSFGATDEFGHEAIEGRVHMHDMHATILHLLGLDHEKLTYRFAGRDFRLTDIAGEVVHEIIA